MNSPVDREYARRYLGAGHSGFLAHVKETGSGQGQEVFALAASNSTLSVTDVIGAFRALDDPSTSQPAYEQIRMLRCQPLFDLAAALASRGTDEAVRDALSVLLGVAQVHGERALDRTSRMRALLLSAELDGEEAVEQLWRRWATGTEPVAELPLLRVTARAARGGADQWWLDALNDIYGLEPVSSLSLVREGLNPLSNLAPSGLRDQETNHGPMVSVLITPGVGDAEVTRRCIDVGEWLSAEILTWDGGRPPSVRGDACLVVESGDWLHPSLIRRLMARLDRRKDLKAVASQRARMTRCGKFVAVRQGASLVEKGMDTLLVRRQALESVREEYVGYASGSALGAQLRTRYNVKIPSATRLPLTITTEVDDRRTTAREALATADRVRRELGKAEIDTERGDLAVLSAEWSVHTYPQGDARAAPAEVTDLDVVYATDLRFPGGNASITVDEIRAATASGFRVGVLPMTSALVAPHQESAGRLIQAIAECGATIVDHETSVRAGLAIVRHPTTVQYEDYRRSNIRPRRLLLVANQIPRLSDGGQAVYDPATVVTNASHLFGVEAELVPESMVTRAVLESCDPKIRLAAFDWPGIIDTSRFALNVKSKGQRPQVGRHSRDHRLKWPDTVEEIRAAYDIPSADVSVLGGVDSLKGEVSSELLQKWIVFPFGSIAAEEYLAGIDIWVYFTSSRQMESFGMAILEAMAAGCVVVLDPSLEPIYGDLARYGSAWTVSDVVSNWEEKNWEQRRQTREDVRAAVAARFGYGPYGRRLTAMIDGSG